MFDRKFVIYCIPEPEKKIFLKSTDSSIKNSIIKAYQRINFSSIYDINFDIAFTDDFRKAEIFVTRDVALKTCSILSSLIPDDFKIEEVN